MSRIKTDKKVTETGLAGVFEVMGGILGLSPAAAKGMAAMQQALMDEGVLDPRLRELVRLRIAFHNQCRTCMAVRYEPDRVTEGLVCSLEKPEEAPDLTDAERAAVRFADLFATDHLAIDDKVYDGLRKYLSEGEIVELGAVCAFYVGFGRLAATWSMTEVLPESFRDYSAKVTPWGHERVLADETAHAQAAE